MVQLYTRNGHPETPNWKDARGRLAVRRSRKCIRCGGLGGAEAWRHTGWTCYRCGGNGDDPTPEVFSLYTAEENARLDEAQAKRQATKRRKAEAAAEIERQRREREKAEIISAHTTLLARIDEELTNGENEILTSVAERIREKALHPTDRQLEVVDSIIAKRVAERERLARVGHVGEIGERRKFTLTLLFVRSEITGQFPTIWRHWLVFHDENGNKIVSKSAPWSFDLATRTVDREKEYVKGQTVTVKATVKEHGTDKRGEPFTRIDRPSLKGC